MAGALITCHHQYASQMAAFSLGRLVAGLGGTDIDTAKLCARCLAAISEYDAQSRTKIVSLDKGLNRVISLLDSDDEDTR